MPSQTNALLFSLAVLPLGLVFTPPPAEAASFTFDFEDQPAEAINASQFTSLTLTSGTLQATITRPNSTPFSITDLSPSGGCLVACAPTEWGSRTLSPFAAESTNDYFLVEFSQAVAGVSIETGDRNVDADTATLELYSSVGLLGSTTQSQNSSASIPDNFLTLSLSDNQVTSIRLYGGSSPNFNSLFWDNLKVTTVDAPSKVPAPLPLAGAALAFRFSRKLRHRLREV